MLSWRPCICMILTFMCGLAMRTSTAITCTISGQESRVSWPTFFKNNNQSCESTTKVKTLELSLSGQNGTLGYRFQGMNENLTLLLENITSSTDYMKIHLFTCENTTCARTGKVRFGQNIKDQTFTEVFEYFQNYSFKQKCRCFLCHYDNRSNESCPPFFCNCKFSNYSIDTAQPLEPHTTTTFTDPTTYPQTSTAAGTETTHNKPTTSDSTSTTQDSTSTKIDYVSAARQPDGDSVPTLAAVGALVALVVIVSGVTVFVCLRRRKWNKKQSDYSEPCVTNPSYGDSQDNITTTGHDNAGNEGNGDVHTYDMADYQKLTAAGELDYSYANFGGQSKFQDQKSPPTIPEITGNTKVLLKRDVTSEDDDYDLARAVPGDKGVNSNSTTLPGNYFNAGKTGRQLLPLRKNSNDNYFVLENGANERVEAMQTMKESFSPEGGNYFLVHESENAPSLSKDTSAISKTGNGGITTIQDDNYFLIEQQTNSEENNQENCEYALAQSQLQTENGYGSNRNNEQIKTDRVSDPYDHVRVGHVQTNGINDGVYDELRKQNVRYKSEEVENDYDRCPATGHL